MAHQCGCGLDLNLASEVQQLLLPKSSPLCNWCCIGARNRMANGLGGDYFDFIEMPDQCQMVFLGDVTGHGLQASVVMSLLYGFLHRSTRNGCKPIDTILQVNEFLQRFAQRSREYDHFFSTTLFFSIIDPDTLQMHYVNAGHPAPMVLRGDRVQLLTPTAQPLGFFDDLQVEMRSFQFEKEDRFLLFTDGITEATDGAQTMYGRQRLEGILRSHRGDHMEFLEEIFDDLRDFGAMDPPEDDCTAIVIDFHGGL
ncbi:serine phosphatase [Desulfuromonas versatilis]|uniref:Serine phosphatase n=1 Tax=Desulfuromonas versatilis TaxID=2802975 RepID=A0ABN6DU65_9BACT|nr:PP2C family protein-serine/threonine phosphatase [Desulfuromonas versatilis]BCR03662.1 serine phosphatase [Desulfuromonas versatilis]